MAKNLVIVESPAKAKTIEKYLGGDFTVLSSVGHIRSIPKKSKDGTPVVDIKNGFKTQYEVDPEKKKILAELKKAVKSAETVWLATDEDREGEAIAWHLCEVLKLDPKTTKRIVFHEITKPAIEEAIKNPRTVDEKLVDAQQARRILDRLVGYELSPVLWKKVRTGLSAGRVQSVAVRLIVEREREIRDFTPESTFKVTAVFKAGGEEVPAELDTKLSDVKTTEKWLEKLIGATYKVDDIEQKPGTRSPGAPFTTSTLQQEASRRLGYSVRQTMTLAQRLYESGHITYMRTDSVNLSGQAIASATEFIKRLYGPEYSTVRKFKTKNSSAQEAHEAIRPTDMSRETASNNEYDQKLYDLIRRRTLASQMAPAKLEKTTITIQIHAKRVARGGAAPSSTLGDEGADRATGPASSDLRANSEGIGDDGSGEKLVFEAKGEVIVFDGFLRVYGGGKEEILPAIKSGEALQSSQIEARQIFARPPARYTEGSLVKKLEDLGIGRPSTYATIIDTVQTRGYVEKGEGEGEPRDVIVLQLLQSGLEREIVQEKTGSTRGKLIPTPAGELIADFLGNHFEQVVDYGFTASVEEHFDDIAENKLARNTMLENFYTPFHKLIEASGGIDRSTVGEAREIGTDPKSGKPILARFGRFGPMLQLGNPPKGSDEKPQFAPMPKGARIDSVTLEQALTAFKLPRTVGTTSDGQEIKANIGRFGPYIQVGKLFVSIKPEDPHEITLEKALELYEAKLKAEAEKNIADFGDGLKVLNGRFGPYITDGKKNAKVPKDTDPKSITHSEAKKLLAAAPAKKGRRIPKRKK